MKVLVTGAAGWLGRFLCPLLQARGHDVVGLDPVASAHTDVVGSVADDALVSALFQEHGFDAVVHAGALHKPDIARHPQRAFVDVNVQGTLNLLENACRTPGTRFVFTSTTSLMISQSIRDEDADTAVWLDETHAPLEPRNIYGVTKLAAEGLCRQHHLQHGLDVVVLRTSRFFPEDDDTQATPSGPNLKALELLHRRASVQDMARAHVAAVEHPGPIGFGLYLVSAPTPFAQVDLSALKTDAASVIRRHFPDVDDVFARAGWVLPSSVGRVYDGRRICRALGFTYETTFAAVLQALRQGKPSPLVHDASYVSPLVSSATRP